jgi:hypothetical protein
MLIPIKTNDIVSKDNNKYVVNGVQVSSDGPILEIQLLSPEKIIVHVSEVDLFDSSESHRRAKSLSGDSEDLVEDELYVSVNGLNKNQIQMFKTALKMLKEEIEKR